jgi:ADP-heptose:LPS heptosyltransferase
VELGIRLERRLKRKLFGLLTGGASAKAVDPSTIDLTRCRRALLVRVNVRMGNLLLVTPALAALRQALPHARLDVLCYDTYASLLAHDPDVDRVFGFDRRMLCNPWALGRLVRTLRREQYDLVVEGARGASLFGALLAGVSGGRYRAGAAGSRYQAFFNVHVPRRPNVEHKVDLLLAFLQGLGVPPVTRSLKVVLTDAERARAQDCCRAYGLQASDTTVGIIVGGRGRKRWPHEQLLELIRDIQARPGVAVVLFPGPEERHEAARLNRDLIHPVVVAPQLGIRDFAALLSSCTLVVTGDTGPMHLAAAVGVPTVAVFHATRARSYAPRGPLHRAVQVDAARGIEGVRSAVGDVLGLAVGVRAAAMEGPSTPSAPAAR